MNAKLLERLLGYREKHRTEFTKTIISQKIEHQFTTLGERVKFFKYEKSISDCDNTEGILLIEARAAKEYWKIFGSKICLGGKIEWNGRKAHNKDIANQLLDIGYHYLVQKISKVFIELNIPTELGFFHKAQSASSFLLVYDFMEWIRPIVVDEVLLKMVHKKKKSIEIVNKKLISNFIFRVKKEFEQKYYHKKLGYCVTLDYWIKLLVLNFEESVNKGKPYRPAFPSLRHETRCKTCKTKPPELNSGR
jgi:CRISPR-associated endonuclease Cas1